MTSGRADEFGPFTMTQVKDAFRSFDLDKNGYVGAAELRHVYASIGEEVTDEEIDEMIRMVDSDGDGQISSGEFAKMIFRYAPQAEEKKKKKKDGKDEKGDKGVAPISVATSLERKLAFEDCMASIEMKVTEVQAVLKRYNGHPSSQTADGKVNLLLFADLLQLEPSPKIERMFNLFDMRGTGMLDIKEFLVLLTNYAGYDHDQKLAFAFKLFDADNSHHLSKEELVRILKANYLADHGDQVVKKAEAIMRQADKDGDQTINFEEFVAVCKKFPNLLFPTFESKAA